MIDPAETLRRVCDLLVNRSQDEAASILRAEYPHIPPKNQGRKYTPYQCLRVYLRDGFRDRYTGQRLVNPAALRFVSVLLPIEFPCHKNWKQSESHIAYYELSPTVDHLVPVARGGRDSEENWITTSMLRNSAKGNALVEELGWKLHEPGNLSVWDGLTGWVVEHLGNVEDLQAIVPAESRHHCKYIATWTRASARALAAA